MSARRLLPRPASRWRLPAVGGWSRWGSRAAAVTVPVVLTALAVVYPGVPVSQVDLNDGAVWLTNTTALKLGRYNPRIEELNAGLVAAGTQFDVVQDGADVLLVEQGRVSVVDPASVTLAAQTTAPTGAVVTLAAGTVAVSEPASGAAWVRPVADLGALSVDRDEPDVDLGTGGMAVMSRGGVALGVDADGGLHRAEVVDGEVVAEQEGALEGASGPYDQVTAVGEELVALAGRTLLTPGGPVDLGAWGGDLLLQQPGPAADAVLVGVAGALLEVPLAGGRVVDHPTGSTGTPAAPVRVGSCGHGAWASATGSYLQLCDGRDAVVEDLEGMTTADQLVFRVNRDVVVLNDTLRGRLWMPLEDPDLREPNWQDIEPQQESDDTEQDSESRQSTQDLQAECTAQSAPPEAVDDEYGVRAGRSTILSVIDNDGSTECGILAVTEFDPVPEEFGTLVPVHGGRALQLTTQPDASGSVEVTYTISDGRGSSAPSTATVTLTVSGETDNAAPEQQRVGTLLVEQGGAGTRDVLPDFRDPDGDHLVLVGAAVDSGGTVRTRQDGELTFRSDGAALGRHDVRVLVSDGTETIEGSVLVDVRPAGSLAPVIDPVHVVTYVDQTVVVTPLDHVRSTSREPVRLAGVEQVPGTTLEPDLAAGTFTFTSSQAGTYYVPFLVTASPQQATGIARVDVRERPEESPPPVAVLDAALLPPGGEVTIAPLANDVSPSGGVLVLQSVEADAGTGLQVEVLDHELLRLSSTRVLTGPTTLRYTVSDGAGTATGEVLVQPIPASSGQQAPVVPDVEVSVRTGGVVTIPVLEGAYDPDGDPLTLVPELAEPLAAGDGLLFVSGDVLRYQAPATPREVHATFNVSDPSSNTTAASLTVTVHASDPETKAPPRPEPLTARVFEGETVRIDVPLTGIDPDGDGVSLLGQDEAPTKGRVVAVGADWIEYEALPGELGTDTFTYAVEDWVGQRAVATVQVGIAPRPTTSAQVISRNDDVTVRPGQSVEVRVLANDTDSGGGELSLEPELVHEEGVEARAVGRRVVVQTPDSAAVLQISYTATNERGGQDSAVLTVTVTPDAPILPPVARDVVVPATETVNATSVEVDVLGVAENPSGPLSDLLVSVDPSVAEVATVTPAGTVQVTLVAEAQTLPYLLTNTSPDAEGVASYAFITVPALGDFPPVARPGAPELRVVAGEPLRISLAEQVQVAPGRTPRILDPARVTATKSDGTPLVVDDRTLTYTAQRTYAGPASISFEVSDGEAGDPTARSRVMTLPVTVLAAADYPPTFSPSVVDVAPGESARVNLTAFTSAPVGTATGASVYTYRLTSPAPDGLTVRLDGTALTVSAAPTVPKGTVGGVALEIGYGVEGRLAAQVDFRVVASQRALARVREHVLADGVEGRARTVAALEGAFNPFPDSPLTLVGAVVETPGAGTASAQGGQVTVRPADGFLGPMVTRYRVRDVTGDPDREVEGRITLVVRGAPDAPTAPRATEVRDSTVVLAWDAPAANGEPITGYRVTAQPGGVVRECASTTCTIDGLTNNTQYTFTVQARNAVDWSAASPASAPARPDAKPFAPSAPTLQWGDASVTATWVAPENPGSPITRYELEISPAPPGGSASVATSSTSYTFRGLANGTEYSVRVRAVNDAPEPGDFSGWSAAQVPAAPPGAPVGVTATREGIGFLGDGEITVTWSPGPANGDPVAGYEVRVDGGSPVDVGAAQQFRFTGERGRTYVVDVRARNKAGTSPWASTTGRVWSPPSAPRSLAARDAAEDGTPFGQGKVLLSWQAPADSGGRDVRITDYEVEGVGRGITGTSLTVPGLSGGQSYTFRVRAWNSENAASEWVTSPAATPTTVPDRPDVVFDTSVTGEVTVTWSTPRRGGSRETRYEFLVEEPGRDQWEAVDASVTSRTFTAVPGTRFEIEVRVRNDRGWSEIRQAGVDVPAAPPPEPEPEPPTP